MAGEIVNQRAVGDCVNLHHSRASRQSRSQGQPPAVAAERQGVNRALDRAENPRGLSVVQVPQDDLAVGRDRKQPRVAAKCERCHRRQRAHAQADGQRAALRCIQRAGGELDLARQVDIERADETHAGRRCHGGRESSCVGLSPQRAGCDPAPYQLLLRGRQRLFLEWHPAFFVRIGKPANQLALACITDNDDLVAGCSRRIPSSESSASPAEISSMLRFDARWQTMHFFANNGLMSLSYVGPGGSSARAVQAEKASGSRKSEVASSNSTQ